MHLNMGNPYLKHFIKVKLILSSFYLQHEVLMSLNHCTYDYFKFSYSLPTYCTSDSNCHSTSILFHQPYISTNSDIEFYSDTICS